MTFWVRHIFFILLVVCITCLVFFYSSESLAILKQPWKGAERRMQKQPWGEEDAVRGHGSLFRFGALQAERRRRPGPDVARSIYEHGFQASGERVCPDGGEGVSVLIVVASAAANVRARRAIRLTWGHFARDRQVALAFLVGRAPGAEAQLSREAEQHGDMIRCNSVDSFQNLTLKSMALLEWARAECRRAKCVLKADDDVFVDVPRLLSFVVEHEHERRAIFGRLASNWKPIRNKASDYYVSYNQYSLNSFPDFTTGPAYLLTSDIVHEMFEKALNTTYIQLEDIFLTGIVAEALGIRRIHEEAFLNARLSEGVSSAWGKISVHITNYSQQYELWKTAFGGR